MRAELQYCQQGLKPGERLPYLAQKCRSSHGSIFASGSKVLSGDTWALDHGCRGGPCPWTQQGGARYSRERLVGGRPPPWPPQGFVLASFTSKFTNNLEQMACNLITLFVIFFHVIISHDYRLFLEVPPFEELQDPSNSPPQKLAWFRFCRNH